MTGNEIRKTFINYFKSKGHTFVRSSSLIPENDPTLLFVNSGMVQFKRCFIGEDIRKYKTATTYQKSIRAGGKHNDLENVGYTARHHTFFEMLGNFSFGDYFKKDAINYAWDLLTNYYKLPKKKLWVSIFNDDDEAFEIWHKEIGVPKERIVRLGEKDNFWAMGDTGPCGPCSEIHYDRGKEFGCGKKDCAVGCDCERFLEIWNLVFMQFEQDEKGKRTLLPKPSIDTGLGLERLASILQNVPTNYETDLFMPIIKKIETLANIKLGASFETNVAIKVIADHSRSSTFIICDGILPSNEGRGYVLRRIIRRAIRYGKYLNLNEPFLHKVCESVIKEMSEAYPELKESQDFIMNVLKNEEERFFETLDNGLKLLNELIENIKQNKEKQILGKDLFKLYDSFGFPLDIVKDILKNQDIKIDEDGYEIEMAKQKAQSKKTMSFDKISNTYKNLNLKDQFVGYENTECESEVFIIVKDSTEVKEAKKGDKIEIVTSKTPFYAESGGQDSDIGVIQNENCKIQVDKTFKNPMGLFIHLGTIIDGKIEKGNKVKLLIDKARRQKIANNHTTTHILHSALVNILGKHIKQAGSFVTADYFRFDFSHFKALTEEEIFKIEQFVNEKILQNFKVSKTEMKIEDALKDGATAIFEEKYGDFVRVISIGNFSKELCGGTHTAQSGNIGVFKIISESSVAAGIRRIEALTGLSALNYIQNLEKILNQSALILKEKKELLPEKLSKILLKQKELEKEIKGLKEKQGVSEINLSNIKTINGIQIYTQEVKVENPNELRNLADKIKNKIKSGIIVLGAKINDKAFLIVVVSKDLTNQFKADEIIKQLSLKIDGTGGGRDDMAQAGGSKTENLSIAINEIFNII